MNTRIVILAAGKGKRMQSEKPKVLHELKGKPIISYLTDSVMKTGIDASPVVVVAPDGVSVRETLGEGFTYVIQEKQLGTGHAVQCAETALTGKADSIIVLYGDQPFITSKSILRLKELHESSGRPITMMTVTVSDFDGWRKSLYDFGRIVRDAEGGICRITEKKDATDSELAIRELNPSFYCFQADWLWENLKKLNNENAQKEYYLTDLVRIAIDDGLHIASIDINPLEAIGVNTSENLELAKHVAQQNWSALLI